jgi:transposase
MRGEADREQELFCMLTWEDVIPKTHPLRGIKGIVDRQLREMSDQFDAAYSNIGRPSIPPEQLIKGMLLQALFTIRSERQLCEQVNYNLLFKWFLDMHPDSAAWHPTVYSKNRQRLEEHGLMKTFFEKGVGDAITSGAASTEHFSVDGTLIEAWASMKSFRPKDEEDDHDEEGRPKSNGWASFKGEKRSNETHESKTDGEARLMRKGWGEKAAMSHSAHLVSENRNGIIMDVQVAVADGRAEREAALQMIDRVTVTHGITPATVGADKGYDAGAYIEALEARGIAPHVAIIKPVSPNSRSPHAPARRRAQQRATTPEYTMSLRARMKIEPIFGWLKTVGGMRKTHFVGRWKTQLNAYAQAAAFNLKRLSKIGTLNASPA